MRRQLAAILVLTSFAFAGIVDDVRLSLAQSNFSGAESALNSYKSQRGVTPEYLEALSWMARGALSMQQYTQAESYAKQTLALATPALKNHAIDSDDHMATAIGAALEVQAQSLAGRGQKAQGIAVLRHALQTYGNTSIAPRLHKNLNLLTFVGQPAPSLRGGEFLGMRSPSLAELKGSPVLLFFWAHWCMDCKGESPILARLHAEFKDLTIIAPTQRYGYAAAGEDATPQAELSYIKKVWDQYYTGLQSAPVPVSKENFNVYGASTTPTLVLIDRTGKIAYYHPGAVMYDELRAAIKKVVNS
ncbi:MAG TPA: TlpA disulfide reductase family protein [Terriglobales bacterium]|nr:TlpA disulfide reductase family protein [Terriglobales bacterium]